MSNSNGLRLPVYTTDVNGQQRECSFPYAYNSKSQSYGSSKQQTMAPHVDNLIQSGYGNDQLYNNQFPNGEPVSNVHFPGHLSKMPSHIPIPKQEISPHIKYAKAGYGNHDQIVTPRIPLKSPVNLVGYNSRPVHPSALTDQNRVMYPPKFVQQPMMQF